MSAEEVIVRSKGQNIDGYNHAFGPCRFLLRILGAWPGHDNAWATIRAVFVMLTMFCFTTSSQTIKMALSITDINIVTEIFVNCNIPITIATVKIFSVWYHKQVLNELLTQVVEDWSTSRRKEEMTMMWKNARISRFFTIGVVFLNQASLTTQNIANLMKPISHARKLSFNESEERPLYFIGSFPYNAQVSPNYELTIFGQLLSNVFASYTFSATDSFYYVLVFHVIGQLSILELSISELPESIKNENHKIEFIKRFKCIHADHNRLWRFYSAIEESFNVMFLIQMVPCIFVLCTQGYMLIMLTGAEHIPIMDLIFMIYFLMLFLFTIFGYCYVAEALRQKSMEVSTAVYDCDWTSLQATEARLLTLIIVRSQHPFEITAGKFAIFSLELYCSILKTSAGYLSMLLAVKDRMMDNGKMAL